MFYCQLTGKLSAPGEKGVRIVTETRPHTYVHYDKYGNEIKTTYGTEIVKEKYVCREAAEIFEKGKLNV